MLKQADLLNTGEEEKFFRYVPINLKKSFDANPILALQNHCGVSTAMSSSFMTNLKYLFESYNSEELPIFQNNHLYASTGDDTQLIEFLIPENIIKADYPHSLFLDLSVQNDTGALCCTRYDGVFDNKHIHTVVFTLAHYPTLSSQTKHLYLRSNSSS